MIELINTLIEDAFYISYVKFRLHIDIYFIKTESSFPLLSYNFRDLDYRLKNKIEYV